MDAIAEGDLAVRALPGHIEPQRVLERARIQVGGGVRQHQPLALRDWLPCYFRVVLGGAHEVPYRRGDAHQLLDGVRYELRLAPEERQLVRVLREEAHPLGYRGGRRVVAGGGHDQVVPHRLQVRHGRPVDEAVGDARGEVVGRVRPAVRAQGGEVLEEVPQDRQDVLRVAILRDKVGIAGAEHLLGELEHPGVVLFRKPENREYHLKGEGQGDFRIEVDLAAASLQRRESLSAQLVQARLELTHAAGLEPVVGEHAVLPVLRVVHVDERLRPWSPLCPHLQDRIECQDWFRAVREELMLGFDLENLVPTDDRPEGTEALGFDRVERAPGVKRERLFAPRGHVSEPLRVAEQVGRHAPSRSARSLLAGAPAGMAAPTLHPHALREGTRLTAPFQPRSD